MWRMTQGRHGHPQELDSVFGWYEGCYCQPAFTDEYIKEWREFTFEKK
jgi:hypothetical protein